MLELQGLEARASAAQASAAAQRDIQVIVLASTQIVITHHKPQNT
ncbi:hypothetical protein [Pseudomonas sp. Z6-14]